MKNLTQYLREEMDFPSMTEEQFKTFKEIIEGFLKELGHAPEHGKLTFEYADPYKGFVSDGRLFCQFNYWLDKPVDVKCSEDFTSLIRFDRRWMKDSDKATAHIKGVRGTLYYKNGKESVNFKGKHEPEWELWIYPEGTFRRYRSRQPQHIEYSNWRGLCIRKETLEELAEGNDVTQKDMSAQNFFRELKSVIKD